MRQELGLWLHVLFRVLRDRGGFPRARATLNDDGFVVLKSVVVEVFGNKKLIKVKLLNV